MTTILHIREDADDYHKRRAEKHGYLFTVVGSLPRGETPYDDDLLEMVEAKSIKTGETLTLYRYANNLTEGLRVNYDVKEGAE